MRRFLESDMGERHHKPSGIEDNSWARSALKSGQELVEKYDLRSELFLTEDEARFGGMYLGLQMLKQEERRRNARLGELEESNAWPYTTLALIFRRQGIRSMNRVLDAYENDFKKVRLQADEESGIDRANKIVKSFGEFINLERKGLEVDSNALDRWKKYWRTGFDKNVVE